MNRHLCVANKKNWGTKEDKGKSRVLYVLQYTKQHLSMSSSEKITPIALAVVELQLSEGIRQTDMHTLMQTCAGMHTGRQAFKTAWQY